MQKVYKYNRLKIYFREGQIGNLKVKITEKFPILFYIQL